MAPLSGLKEQETVELIKNKYTKNIANPFINKSKNWDDKDHWAIPEDLQQNILSNLGFMQPSNIQAVSIPLITNAPHHDLIAQAKNGCGKTGSFVIGSVMRVDRENPNTQVICIASTRELVNQISSVYEQLCKGTGITVANSNFHPNFAQKDHQR